MIAEVYRFLADENELRWAWKFIIAPLNPREAHFISLSARNKQLDEEERRHYQVGRSEMFAKQVVADDAYETYVKHIRRCEANKQAFLTKSSMPYPDKVLVMYMTLPKVDCYRAMDDQMTHLMGLKNALLDSALKGSAEAINESYKAIRHTHSIGQSIFARCWGHNEWIDIDVDAPLLGSDELHAVNFMTAALPLITEIVGVGNVAVVHTAGGEHWLIRKRCIKQNPTTFITVLEETLKYQGYEYKEVVRNTNLMIPHPGTVQYGTHIVRVLNKSDFTEEHVLHS
jgi:hypothetical protein